MSPCTFYPVFDNDNIVQSMVQYHNQDLDTDTVKMQNTFIHHKDP